MPGNTGLGIVVVYYVVLCAQRCCSAGGNTLLPDCTPAGHVGNTDVTIGADVGPVEGGGKEDVKQEASRAMLAGKTKGADAEKGKNKGEGGDK